MKTKTERRLLALLTAWCDALMRLQLDQPHDDRLSGGLLCPACGMIHGRCHEAVYPLLSAAAHTGNPAYRDAAVRLFRWGLNMNSADGGSRNDFDSDWKGVTAFAAIALHDALKNHGALLTEAEKAAWGTRLAEMSAWLHKNLTTKTPAYLNYYAATACALALTGTYFSKDDCLETARQLAAYCLKHVSENGLIYGEGRPNDAVSPKGCRAVDVGYNAEETLPCLTRYALSVGDAPMLAKCRELWRAQAAWMLPDGAWDNSVGTRSFKWTYWGSRTTDGGLAELLALGKDDPVLAEAALRNLDLLERCTHDGLLTGGPDYHRNGEPVCVHHTFCHAKTLAAALDAGAADVPRAALPDDDPEPLRYYPELDVYRLAIGDWRMTVSGYDFVYPGAVHATGGCISLLWHKAAGALAAVGQVDDNRKEPNNQQLPVHPEQNRCACPRLEVNRQGKSYGQHFCADARLNVQRLPDGAEIFVDASLCDKDGAEMPENGACSLEYRLTKEALAVSGSVRPAIAGQTQFVLPLNGDKAELEVICGVLCGGPTGFFRTTPGFLGKEYRILPNPDGRFCVRIRVKE